MRPACLAPLGHIFSDRESECMGLILCFFIPPSPGLTVLQRQVRSRLCPPAESRTNFATPGFWARRPPCKRRSGRPGWVDSFDSIGKRRVAARALNRSVRSPNSPTRRPGRRHDRLAHQPCSGELRPRLRAAYPLYSQRWMQGPAVAEICRGESNRRGSGRKAADGRFPRLG